jgi:DNA-binding CsgD family transcriptional regulator
MSSDDVLQQRAEIWKGRTAGAVSDDALPPYQVLANDFLVTGVVFDPEAAAHALPEGLKPLHPATGLFVLYQAPTGWGLAPFSACFVAVGIEGHDATDGSSAHMIVAGWYSDRAGRIMHDNYNTRMVPGEAVHSFEDGVWRARGGPVGETFVSVELRPTGQDAAVTSSIHHYIGVNRNSGLNIFSVSCTGRYLPAESLRLEIGPGAPTILRSLEPIARPFALHVPAMTLTISAPRSLSDPAERIAQDAARVMLLDVFAHLGRAAAILGRDGRIIHLNPEAEMLAGDGFVATGRVMRAAKITSHPALERALERAFQGERTVEPVALERLSGSPPLLAYAMPMSPTAAGETSVLLVFADPACRSRGETSNALRLLGLTPAEARLASLVGSGQSPKKASERLSITENTARSVLKIIYDKLAINRQSELAQVVARIESM